jgi:hypothetical protein
MTSLAGEFQTDLSLDDALVACAEAIDGLGWRIEAVGSDRIVSYPGHGPSQQSPRIEVQLVDRDGATNLRIVGSDSDAKPLARDDLIAELDRVRDAITASVEGAGQPAGPPRPEPARPVQGPPPPPRAMKRRDRSRGVVIGALAFLLGAALATAGIRTAGIGEQTSTVQRTAAKTTVRTQTETVTTGGGIASSPRPTAGAPTPGSAAGTASVPASSPARRNCDPNYAGACLNPRSPDYDCRNQIGGGGNGPDYVAGTVVIVGKDHFGLDGPDHDGVGCG